MIEIRTTSDGKVVFAVKDELTLKADQAGLSDTEMEVFKGVLGFLSVDESA